MRRLLAIAGVFPPAGGAGSLRTLKLLKYLPDFGWRAHVVAPRARSGWFADPSLAEELRAFEVTRCGSARRKPLGEGLRRRAKDPAHTSSADGLLRAAVAVGKRLRDDFVIPDEYLPWALSAYRAARTLMRRRHFDVMLTASFPYSCHLTGLALRAHERLPWIADFADPWAGHRFRGQESGLRSAIDHRLEASVLERCDAITVASPGMKRLLADRLAPAIAAKTSLLTNAFDHCDFAAAVTAAPSAAPFRLLFVGTFDARLTPPHPFIDAFVKLLQRRRDLVGRLEMRVLGGSDLESSQYIRSALRQIDVEQVLNFVGYVSHSEAVAEMRAADALAISVAEGAHWHLTAKIFEYLASGTPILAILPDGDCRDLVRHSGGAAVFYPSEVDGLARCLDGIARTQRLVVDRPVDPAVLADLSARAVAERTATLLDELVNGGSAPHRPLPVWAKG